MSERPTFLLDGEEIPFEPGETIIQAALAAGRYIPHLCYHPEFKPHGSCKVCTIRANGRFGAACTLRAQAGLEVESETEDLRKLRRTLVQMLFAEGNHFCPACERSGNCKLQALGYDLEVLTAGFRHFYPNRPVDASHPDILIDFMKRLIRDAKGKKVFLILDNLRVHHAKPVKKWLSEHQEQIEVFYLPSYSPELNPDESQSGRQQPSLCAYQGRAQESRRSAICADFKNRPAA